MMKKLIGHIHFLTGEFTPLKGSMNMAKKNQEVATRPDSIEAPSQLAPIDKLTPAVVLGVSSKMKIDQALLPEEFRGVELETIETGFAPAVKWMEPGNFVGGIYEGFEEEVGPNSSRLYNFRTKQDKPFSVWGTTILDKAFDDGIKSGLIAPGRKILIIYLGDIPVEGKNDCKMFQLSVKKVSEAA